MRSVVVSLLLTIRVSLRDRAALQLEILALRHQLHVLNRSRPQRLRLTQADRMLWVFGFATEKIEDLEDVADNLTQRAVAKLNATDIYKARIAAFVKPEPVWQIRRRRRRRRRY